LQWDAELPPPPARTSINWPNATACRINFQRADMHSSTTAAWRYFRERAEMRAAVRARSAYRLAWKLMRQAVAFGQLMDVRAGGGG